MTWSAAQYSKFENERNRPIRDLLDHLSKTDVARAVDIGSGPGNSTEMLCARYPDAHVTGIDNSSDMIEAAQKRLPHISFEQQDISTWQDIGPFDMILANAALQWVPDHEILFPSLIEKLSPGGCLAVQMPDNTDEPVHWLMRDIASDGPWAHKMTPALKARAPRHCADWYYNLLRPVVSSMDIWRTTYYHPLAGGAEAVVEWFKGTGLRPYLEVLDEGEKMSFLAHYQAAIERAYTLLPDGSILLPFPRLFIVATR